MPAAERLPTCGNATLPGPWATCSPPRQVASASDSNHRIAGKRARLNIEHPPTRLAAGWGLLPSVTELNARFLDTEPAAMTATVGRRRLVTSGQGSGRPSMNWSRLRTGDQPRRDRNRRPHSGTRTESDRPGRRPADGRGLPRPGPTARPDGHRARPPGARPRGNRTARRGLLANHADRRPTRGPGWRRTVAADDDLRLRPWTDPTADTPQPRDVSASAARMAVSTSRYRSR